MKTKFLPLSMCLVGSLLAGCNSAGVNGDEIEIKLLESYHGEYILGNVIDVGYFFYCSDRSAAKITVTYTKDNKSVTKDVQGEAYYPEVTGLHHFVLKAGNKSISHDIEVVDEMPTIEIQDKTFVAKADAQIYFSDIYNEVSVKYTPSISDLTVKEVKYAPFDFKVNATETNYSEDVTMKARYFNGSKAGKYRMTLEVVSGARVIEDYIYIDLVNSDRDGNSKVKQNEGIYISNYVALDSTNDNNFIFPRCADIKDASYALLSGDYNHDNPLGLEFKGKNMPSFGLNVSPNEDNGTYGPLSISDGYFLTFNERGTDYFTCYSHSKDMFKGGESRPGSFGVDALEDDKYYYMELSFSSEFDQYASSKKPYYHELRYSLYEIENYGSASEKLSDEALFVLEDIGGWYDAYEASSQNLMLYGSTFADVTIKLNNR